MIGKTNFFVDSYTHFIYFRFHDYTGKVGAMVFATRPTF